MDTLFKTLISSMARLTPRTPGARMLMSAIELIKVYKKPFIIFTLYSLIFNPAIADQEIKVSADSMSANRQTGAMCATGNVQAVSGVFRFFSQSVSKSADNLYDFGEDAMVTTCTNDLGHLHWHATGHLRYQDKKSVQLGDGWLYHTGWPVLWAPFWYYPLNTNYGWRLMPGYKSRWGGYIKAGYVYGLINNEKQDPYALGGSTYADYRTKNGFALGQTLRWKLGDWGKGKIKGYEAWDLDHDRYTDHMYGRKHRYANWGSDVDYRRWRLLLEHKANFTERDALRVRVQSFSDSHFQHDFFDHDERDESIPVNEAWYEHRENDWSLGANVGGPVDKFYSGTARLPEAWLAINPTPIWTLNMNYESQTRAGYLNRQYAKYATDDPMFRYHPFLGESGRGADYQAFRADTYHRISAGEKFFDLISFNPRTSYRCTYWSDGGDGNEGFTKASGDPFTRHIGEAGFVVSTRAVGDINENWRHTFEPYIDYSYQWVGFDGNHDNRYYYFDSYDRSLEWLDQFGFEGRGLPYAWHGARPGLRNLYERRDSNGIMRTIFDTDFYAAIPFESHVSNDRYGNYTQHDCIVPGVRAKWHPDKDTVFGLRTEYDCNDDKVAYADATLRQRLTKDLSWHIAYIARDHRVWDYLPSNVARWNEALNNIVSLGFEHTLCDWFAYAPFIRYDCRHNEVDEIGAWFDFMTDCLGYRIQFEYERSYRRIDGSKHDDDLDVCFFIYLRALGPGSMLDLFKF